MVEESVYLCCYRTFEPKTDIMLKNTNLLLYDEGKNFLNNTEKKRTIIFKRMSHQQVSKTNKVDIGSSNVLTYYDRVWVICFVFPNFLVCIKIRDKQ